MRILIIGASGKAGAAIHHTLSERGYELIGVGRSSGDIHVDITDPAGLEELWQRVGSVDAVVSAAGDVPYRPLADLEPEDYLSAFHGKILSQINLVRTGLPHLNPRGSFTLISGILAREPIVTGAAAAMAGGAVESFVRAAALEIAPRRINVISPSVFTESLEDYGDFFPGFVPVDLSEVARAYVKSVEGAVTGQVLIP
ncbi:short chain dehydrogenase [Nocardiopsis alba]|uniref:short chain dehydrogenase n=1 Tax=Nocardiopsis alba TaxID=53437 RepID=UPI0005A98F1A|nr:short chain dehydrogenase [Nocardiopsis alba]